MPILSTRIDWTYVPLYEVLRNQRTLIIDLVQNQMVEKEAGIDIASIKILMIPLKLIRNPRTNDYVHSSIQA